MDPKLQQFAEQCRAYLAAEPGPDGRERVVRLVEELLQDADFVSTHLPPGTPERKVLYEDPDLGFCILAHSYEDARTSSPHDHGPSWAIYGQAAGETEMTEWALVEPATADTPGKVRARRTYKLTPGIAHLYNEGVLHSPRRYGPTMLIRIEGINMDRVKRLPYQPIDS